MATYTVKKDDNLAKLAEKWGVSVSAVLDANAGVSALGPGVTLRIPTVQIQGHPDHQPGDVDPSLPGRQGPTYTPPPVRPGPSGRPPGYTPPGPGRYIPPPPVQQPIIPPRNYDPRNIPPLGVGGADLPPVGGVPQADLSQYNEPRRTGYVPPPIPVNVGIRGAPQGPGITPNTRVPFLSFLNQQYRRWTAPGPSPLDRNIMNIPDDRISPTGTFLNAIQYGTTQERRLRGPVLKPGHPSQTLTVGEMDANEEARQRALALQESYEGVGVGGEGITDVETDPTGSNIRYRMVLADGTTGRSQYVAQMRPEDIGPDGRLTDEAIERYEQSRADDVYRSLQRGEWPQVMTESDRLKNGWSREWMDEHGYFYDEDKGYWSAGQPIEDAPQVAGAALPYSGYGYGYGGGGPRYSYPKGGGGTYTPYFDYTQPGARGQIPRQIQNRPARFGMVTWRI